MEKLSSERYKIIDEIRNSLKKLSKDEILLLMNMERIVEEVVDLNVARMALEY